MTFNSYPFILIFLPITITVFYQLSRYHRNFAVLWLIAASMAFYGSLSLHALPVLILSVLVNYALSLKVAHAAAKKLWLCFGLALNFGLLMWCKLMGSLPLGISFYTFTQSAYMIDVFSGNSVASGFLDYVRHITFFGCIASGPIARITDTSPSFTPDYDVIAKGLTLFMLGLFKKVCIADYLAKTVNTLFSASGVLNLSEAWLAALGYSMQLYFDFSGYSDMAIAIGLMFGMRLPQNFDSPYKSLSLIDFWRRWHMSLGAWIRDYIYIPLGGSREGELRRTRNVMIAMLFTGLWHGWGWSFIVWGGLHGLLLAVNHWWRKHGVRLPAVVSWVLTFGSVVMLWVVFRAESLSDAGKILTAMLDVKNIVLPTKFSIYLRFLEKVGISFVPFTFYRATDFAWECMHIFTLLAAVIVTPNSRQIINNFRPGILWLAAAVSLAVISFTQFSGISDFLYFQF